MYGFMYQYKVLSKNTLISWFDTTTQKISKLSTRSTPGKLLSAATINQRINILKSYSRFCVEFDYLSANPAIVLKNLKPQPNPYMPLDNAQIDKVLSADADPLHFIKYVRFMLLTGVRLHEAAQVHEFAYDKETSVLEVIGKGEKVRKLKLGERSRELFSKISSNPAKSQTVLKRGIDSTLCKVGLFGVSSHCLRATFASRLYEKGIRIEQIQRLLGHSSIDTTRGYIKALRDSEPESIPEEAFLD